MDFSVSASAVSTVEGAVDPKLSQFWQKLSISLKRMGALNTELCQSEANHFHYVLKDYIKIAEAGEVPQPFNFPTNTLKEMS